MEHELQLQTEKNNLQEVILRLERKITEQAREIEKLKLKPVTHEKHA